MINKIIIVSTFMVICLIFLTILCYKAPKVSNRDTLIKNLIRQTARWSAASSQDESPLVSLLHANYGVAYVSIVRDVATDEEIKSLTGINIIDFQQKVYDIQDKATRKVSEKCPGFVGNIDPGLLMIAGHK